ncbi:MAG: VOC family protein [Ferruginibacter sp.]|nr:VOC family protein [Cytophagales bacterium]
MDQQKFRLPDATYLENIRLQVPSLESSLGFYVGLLGLREIGREGNRVRLSANGQEPPLLSLMENPRAGARDAHQPGLYHSAFLVPNRIELARMLKNLIGQGIRLGFGDHGVSEAIYLSDPDGNGVEIYADRPRSGWPFQHGQLAMTTQEVDVAGLLAEIDPSAPFEGAHPATRIGHVHLQVSDLAAAGQFYAGVLGFEVMQQSYPGALFVSAGGYHHHVGLNTWHSRNAGPVSPDRAGLLGFSIVIPDQEGFREVRKRVEATVAGRVATTERAFSFQDPDGIGIRVVLPEYEMVR